MYFFSHIEEDRGLIGELLLLNAKNGAVHLIVNVGQVGSGRALTHTTELVVHGTVAKAHPALIGTQVGHGNATQVSANSRAAQNGRVTGIGNGGLRLLIKLGSGGQVVSEVDLRLSETTHKDHLTVPGSLKHFTWGQFRNVELLVSVTNVTSSGNHLVIDDSEDSLDAENIRRHDEALEHIDLSTLDFVIFVLLIPEAILIEPIVNLGLGIKRVAEVGRTRRGNPVHVTVSAQKVVCQLLVLAVIVLLHDTEVAGSLGYRKGRWLDKKVKEKLFVLLAKTALAAGLRIA